MLSLVLSHQTFLGFSFFSPNVLNELLAQYSIPAASTRSSNVFFHVHFSSLHKIQQHPQVPEVVRKGHRSYFAEHQIPIHGDCQRAQSRVLPRHSMLSKNHTTASFSVTSTPVGSRSYTWLSFFQESMGNSRDDFAGNLGRFRRWRLVWKGSKFPCNRNSEVQLDQLLLK